MSKLIKYDIVCYDSHFKELISDCSISAINEDEARIRWYEQSQGELPIVSIKVSEKQPFDLIEWVKGIFKRK